MTSVLHSDIKQWKVEIELEQRELKRKFEEFERAIELINAKITIAADAKFNVRRIHEENYDEVIIGPLESESDHLHQQFEEFKESYNVRLSYLKSLIMVINENLSIDE